VTTVELKAAGAGAPYSQALAAAGGSGSYTWSLVDGSGSLPPGLGLSGNGTISGTTEAVGNFSFLAQVTDTDGASGTATRLLAIRVYPTFAVTTVALPDAAAGTGYLEFLRIGG
jgi:hypothetical protein